MNNEPNSVKSVKDFLFAIVADLKTSSIDCEIKSINENQWLLLGLANEDGVKKLFKLVHSHSSVSDFVIITRESLQYKFGIFDVRHKLNEFAWIVVEVKIGFVEGKQWSLPDAKNRHISSVRSTKNDLYPVSQSIEDKSLITLLRKVFFQKYNEPGLFTVLGPEGVGKTTTCGMVAEIFKNLPFPLLKFHHTGHWKGDGNKTLTGYEKTIGFKSNSADTSDLSKLQSSNEKVIAFIRTITLKALPTNLKKSIQI